MTVDCTQEDNGDATAPVDEGHVATIQGSVESIAASASECSITTSVFKLSLYDAGQASSIEQESFHGRCPSECILSIVYGIGPMGQRQDEAAALEQDIQPTLCPVAKSERNSAEM